MEKELDISIIDYIGKVNDGIGVLFSWIIYEKYYEFIFWFDKENNYKIFTDNDLNEILKVNDIHEWKYIDNLIIYLNSILLPKEEILKKFL
jgi:hypothetical protein